MRALLAGPPVAILLGLAAVLTGPASVSLAAPLALTATPAHGLATARFDLGYLSPLTQVGDCGAGAAFYWDGKLLATHPGFVPLAGGCAYQATSLLPLAGQATPGVHTLTAVQCSLMTPLTCYTVNTSSAAYRVDIAAIKVSPTSGFAAGTFSATYTLPKGDCGPFTTVRFYWGSTAGAALGSATMNAVTCAASLGGIVPPNGSSPGQHKVTAEACGTGSGPTPVCQSASVPVKPASYTITAPAASPTPSPGPSLSPSPPPSPTPSPSPSPSSLPSPSPSPTAAATPLPTSTVTSSATPAPMPAATPAGGVAGITGSPDPWLPAIAPTIPGPSSVHPDAAVLATNAFLALLFVLLFGLTSEILNSTLDEHRPIVEGWADRLVKRRLRFLTPLARADAWIDGLGQRGRAGAIAQIGAVLGLLGIVYGFLSAGFGFNKAGLVLVLSMMVGLAVILYLNYGGKALVIERLHHAPATVRAYGSAIFIAAVCVIASRWLDFHPGLVYGFVATTVILRPVDLTPRHQARMVLGPAFAVLAASLIAWALLDPLRAATSGADGFFPALAQAVLGIVFIGGLESLLFGLLPIKFMDGSKVMRWSRPVWALIYLVVVFLWVQLLLNRDEAYVDAFRQTGIVAVFAMLGFFMATTGVVWTYFWRRDRAEEAAGAAGAADVAEAAIPASEIQTE